MRIIIILFMGVFLCSCRQQVRTGGSVPPSAEPMAEEETKAEYTAISSVFSVSPNPSQEEIAQFRNRADECFNKELPEDFSEKAVSFILEPYGAVKPFSSVKIDCIAPPEIQNRAFEKFCSSFTQCIEDNYPKIEAVIE